MHVLKGGGLGFGEHNCSSNWGCACGGVKYTPDQKVPSGYVAVHRISCLRGVCSHTMSPDLHVAPCTCAGLHGESPDSGKQSPVTKGLQFADSSVGGGIVGQLGLEELQTGADSSALVST